MFHRLSISILLLISLLYFNSCSTYESDDLLINNPIPIRIAIVIENQQDTKQSTRAAGTTTEGNYSQNQESGNADESYIGTLRLLVFDMNGVLRFNKIFSKAAMLTENQFQLDATTGKLTVQLELTPGTYEFRAVTNEEISWNLNNLMVGSSTLSNYQALTFIQNKLNTITDESILSTNVSSGRGIPMLGSQQFTVNANTYTTVSNPIVLSTINLKRALAKVEVNLTNVDSSTGLVYDFAKNYTIKSVGLYTINQQYNVLENNNSLITETNGTELKAITHSVGALFPKQRVLTAYMAERKNVTETAKTYIVITTDKQGETITYTIPLYSTGDQTISGTKDYNIYRNYLYRVNCILNGSAMPYIELQYSVGDWSLIENYTLMGYGYNVNISDVNFAGSTNNITVYNTIEACDPHQVTLEIPTDVPATFSDGTKVQTFSQLTNGASTPYTINKNNTPSGSVYLLVKYNGNVVKQFTVQ